MSKIPSHQNDCHGAHEFTLVLSGTETLSQAQEDALFEAGCDDATISLRNGRIYLAFIRPAASLFEAILSAIVDIQRADIGMEVLRVDHCDLVTIPDIARLIGRSRQCVHQYINGERGPGGFPPPECELSEGKFLYRWCDVANWLLSNDMIAESELKNAVAIEIINNHLALQRQRRDNPDYANELVRCIPCGN